MQRTREGVMKPVHCYVHCNCQQKYPIMCAISDFVVLLIADAACLMAIGNPEFFFQGRDIGREVAVDRVLQGVYPIPSPPTRDLRERRKLPRWGLGWSSSRKQFLDVLCDFTSVRKYNP